MTSEYILGKKRDYVLALLTPGNRLVCEVMLHTGLRIGDVLSLETDQLKNSRFWVTESKTGKKKLVGLPADLRARILAEAGEKWAFPSPYKPKNHRTRQAVYTDMKRAAKALRVNAQLSPQSTRKIYAVELLAKYGDIERVKRALNHSSMTTTMLYAMADKVKLRRKR